MPDWKRVWNWSLVGFWLAGMACLTTVIALAAYILEYEITTEYFAYAVVVVIGYGALMVLMAWALVKNVKYARSLAKTPTREGRRPIKMRVKQGLFAGVGFILVGAFIFAVFFYAIPYLWPQASAPGNYSWTEGPYLSWTADPKTTMTITWITPAAEDGKARYGTSLSGSDVASPTEVNADDLYEQTKHVATLTGLAPDTLYYYQIWLNGTWVPVDAGGLQCKFQTAPTTAKPFRFAVVGDTRNSGGLTSYCNYSYVVDAQLTHDYNFTINVGDIDVNGKDLNSWHVAMTDVSRDGRLHPYMLAVGNHELGGDSGGNLDYFLTFNFASWFGRYYSFEYANAKFIIVDNYEKISRMTQCQLDWIRAQAADAKARGLWSIISFHEPIYSTGDFNMNWYLASLLQPIFYEEQVDLVLTGHDHHYEAFWVNRTETWGGTYHFVTGGGGAGLDTGILTRTTNQWLHPWHNASQESYQSDYVTLHDQIYGELAHQFLLVDVNGDTLIVESYYQNNTLMPGQRYVITR